MTLQNTSRYSMFTICKKLYVFTVSLAFPTLGFSCGSSGVKIELFWQFLELTAWLRWTKGISCPKQWLLWSWRHREFIYSVTFARRHTHTRSHSGINSLMYIYIRHGLPHILNMSVSLHIFNSLKIMPLISSALHIKLSHTSMLSFACQAEVESSQLEESGFCHKVHLKSLKVPTCQLACWWLTNKHLGC